MEEYQDDLCDFCGTECYCTTKKELEEKEQDLWDDAFCPGKECLDKTGTELV